MFSRYALYYTPPEGPLADFGARWLGWELARGKAVAQPDVVGLDVAAITSTPRKYGFHGTIKPPFRLTRGRNADGLVAAVQDLCKTLAPVALEGLALSRMGRFLALTAEGDSAELKALAARAVTWLDGFRAPPSEAELARRRAARLSARQEQNLRDWGYPHVMQDFRFHMTLTGKIDKATAAQVQEALRPILVPLLPRPYLIDNLTLAGEREDGMFVALERFRLQG